jgi:hypothetical protein
MDSRIYTLNATNGESLMQYLIPMNSRDNFNYDLKNLLYYSSTNDIYVAFRVVDGETKTNIRLLKFRDTNPPLIHWAKTSTSIGYILALGFEES